MTIRSLVHNLKFNKWNLAFTEESLENIVNSKSIRVHYMKGNNRKQWFADPFILDVTSDHIICLVEELSYDTMKGRIAKIKIDRNNYKLTSIKILLDLPTHLSFPFIFRENGNIYVLPENSASGVSTLYIYNSKDDSLTPVKIIAERPLTDATICVYNHQAYVISTQKPTQNGNILDIYSLDLKSLKLSDNPIQSVSFNGNYARNAGEIFKVSDKYFRPSQDCNGGYGKGVILQEMIKTSEGFRFENYCSFYSNSWIYNMGYHTFNSYKGLTVIDAHGYRYPVRGRILEIGTRIVKKFILK